MTKQEIINKATNKAFSKVHFRKIEIDDYKNAIHTGLHGGVTEAETRICLEATKKELKVWNYIAQLIELDNK